MRRCCQTCWYRPLCLLEYARPFYIRAGLESITNVGIEVRDRELRKTNWHPGNLHLHRYLQQQLHILALSTLSDGAT